MRERAVLPSRAALADARSAWSRGDFLGCLALLDRLGGLSPRSAAWVEGILLRSRSLYRLKRYDETIELIEPALSAFADGDESCTAWMLLGSSIARSGDVDRGLKILEQTAARAAADDVHRAVRAEIAHARALAHWTRRELAETERLARIAEAADVDIISVRAMQLRGFVAHTEQRFSDALSLFNRTFDAYWRCRERDAGLAEMTVHQIAALEVVLRSRHVRGTHVIPDRRRIRDPWDTTPEVPSVTRLQTYGMDAWLFALDGDRDSAFRKIRRAEDMAEEPAWRIWALAGRASLAAAFGEPGSAREHAALAAELSQDVPWDATTGEERIGLLLLAEILAVTDSVAATAILKTFDALSRPMDPDQAGSSDSRVRALEDYVRGVILRVNGRQAEAYDFLMRSMRSYEACGHLWRTALARLELHAIFPNEGHFLAAQAIISEHFPNSFLAARVGVAAISDPIVARLTPSQREVLSFLLDGLNAREIATQTGRAYNTVRVHIDRLREAFAASSIHAMVVECHRRGIVFHATSRAHRAAEDERTRSVG